MTPIAWPSMVMSMKGENERDDVEGKAKGELHKGKATEEGEAQRCSSSSCRNAIATKTLN